MKKIFVMLLMAASVAVANAQTKFAHFNMSDVMPNMPEYKTATDEMQKLGAQFQEEYERLQKELQAKAEEFQKLQQDGKTPETIMQNKYQELQKMEESIQNFTQASQQELQAQQGQKLQAITAKIMDAVKKIAEAGSYVYVMDSSTAMAGAGTVVFVNTAFSTDITAQLKTALGIQ